MKLHITARRVHVDDVVLDDVEIQGDEDLVQILDLVRQLKERGVF